MDLGNLQPIREGNLASCAAEILMRLDLRT
jgi:hypothetical protein